MIEDNIGFKLVEPEDNWQSRPDMSEFTRPFRASILARARFVEDLLVECIANNITQYVILGAGLNTFVQRQPTLASRIHVFENDQPGPQQWKRQRLIELGFGTPEYLRLVTVDFEAGDEWWRELVGSDFEPQQAAMISSTGVSIYQTRDAINRQSSENHLQYTKPNKRIILKV